MSKMVSKHGDNKWVKSYAAQPSETVDYLIQYKNVGTAQEDDVTFRDTLPTGMTYVAGSTVFGNSTTPSGTKATDDIANGTGINVGSYASGANAWSIFSATVPTNDQLAACGANTLVNTAKVTTGGGSLQDTANVTVSKTCQPNECKPGIPVGDVRCTPPVTPPVTPPTTPSELPHTGIGAGVSAFLGLGSLIASIGYYVNSRRAALNR
jgi:uncharacterized repeat protein (TIGR01451 family)/LPXTG-motif cell wall-anchored protein